MDVLKLPLIILPSLLSTRKAAPHYPLTWLQQATLLTTTDSSCSCRWLTFIFAIDGSLDVGRLENSAAAVQHRLPPLACQKFTQTADGQLLAECCHSSQAMKVNQTVGFEGGGNLQTGTSGSLIGLFLILLGSPPFNFCLSPLKNVPSAEDLANEVQRLQAEPCWLSLNGEASTLTRMHLLRRRGEDDGQQLLLLQFAQVAFDRLTASLYARCVFEQYAESSAFRGETEDETLIGTTALVSFTTIAQAQGHVLQEAGIARSAIEEYWEARCHESTGDHRRLPRPRFFLDTRSSRALYAHRFRLSRSSLHMFQALLVLPPHCPIQDEDTFMVTCYTALAVLTAYITQQDNFVMGVRLDSRSQLGQPGSLGNLGQVRH